MRNRKNGFTLVEVLTVFLIAAMLAAAAIPTFAGFIEDAKQKKYIGELNVVCDAVQAYLLEEYADGPLDHFEIYEEIQRPKLESEKNLLHKYLDGETTPGARIRGMGMTDDTALLTWLSYVVDGYEIEFYIDEGVTVRKADNLYPNEEPK